MHNRLHAFLQRLLDVEQGLQARDFGLFELGVRNSELRRWGTRWLRSGSWHLALRPPRLWAWDSCRSPACIRLPPSFLLSPTANCQLKSDFGLRIPPCFRLPAFRVVVFSAYGVFEYCPKQRCELRLFGDEIIGLDVVDAGVSGKREGQVEIGEKVLQDLAHAFFATQRQPV